MMGFRAKLLKLVGQHPDQVKHREEYRKSLKGLEDKEKELDALLEDIEDVDEAMREKSEALTTTANSLRPGPNDEEREDAGEDGAV